MNRVFLPFLKSISIAMLAVSSVTYASEHPAPAKADPVKGEALYANGDAARNSTISVNPKLAGQHEAYTAKQLDNFKGADRSNPVMSTFANMMTAEDMKNVSNYLAAQKSKPGSAKNKDIVELGKQIYRGGIAEKNVPACAGCHSPNGVGIPAQFPRVAGQHQDYTIAQLTNFRTGTRKNSVQMTTISKRMSDDEIKAVADYVAGLK